jgi:integrase
MGKFSFYLDKRGKKNKPQDYKYSLCVRSNIKDDTIYLPITTDKKRKDFIKLTEEQYNRVFVKKSLDTQSIDFREKCSTYITKCERIMNSLGNKYTRDKFVQLFKSNEEIEVAAQPFQSVVLKDIFNHYIKNYKMSVKYKQQFQTSRNVFETFQPDALITDITIDYLNRFKEHKIKCSPATIQTYDRNIRRLVNYTKDTLKILPSTYQYPFGRGGYTIGSYFPTKQVISKKEIEKVVRYKDFDSPEQEYALNVWLFLYRVNGINFADLLGMRWDNIKGDYFVFYRRKTRNTRKNNIKPIQSHISPKVKKVMSKIEDKDSPFILGELKEEYSEETFTNKSDKLRGEINAHLKVISKKLNLSVELLTETARDCYATTLYRSGVSKDDIGEMMGHSNSMITEHYISSISVEKTKDINKHIL